METFSEQEELKPERKGLNKLYAERGDFILVGLTGRVGSGCSTTSDILSKEFQEVDFPFPKRDNFDNADERKNKIIYDYARRHWEKFECIRVKDIITSFIVEAEEIDVINFLSRELSALLGRDNTKEIEESIEKQEFIQKFRELKSLKISLEEKDESKTTSIQEKESLFRNFYFHKINDLSEKIGKFLKLYGKTAHAEIYKTIGNNIRSSGKINCDEFDSNHIFDIAKRINGIIKLLRKSSKKSRKSTLFVIDSIRNSFEALFFRERYSAFYLISINTFEEDRIKRLRSQFNLNDKEIKRLDGCENPQDRLKGKDIFISQDVKKCIEFSDIHLNNPQNGMENFSSLKSQLAWYIMLMKHPGIVPPTSVERSMQIAYSAKLGSGCISRQVGAVVTDKNFSIKAVGWNNTPENQVPCLLRSVEDLIRHNDERGFSDYELNNPEFREKITDIYPQKEREERKKSVDGRNISFCFKDIQNKLDGHKNQVHTRSLHAEENAFLQISKYGGEGVAGGILFTTASPCELCAKKAYQLGIEKIYYIDPYPGIALSHVLGSGNSKPELYLFRGAIGRAYYQLYQPTLPFKDELSMLIKQDEPKKTRVDQEAGLNAKLAAVPRLIKKGLSFEDISEALELPLEDVKKAAQVQ
jgi:deoxycytidylate deaminase